MAKGKLPKTKKLKEIIIDLLHEDMENEYKLLHKIHIRWRKLKKGPHLYVGLLKALTDMRFPAGEAQNYWNNILEHRKFLSKKTGMDMSFRVALLDYFININKVMKNPMIIEIKMYEKKTKLALIDGLTNLYNRAYFNRALSREIKRAKRYGEIFSVLFLDMDNFKKYNDAYGHVAGDKVLKKTSKLLTKHSREEDIVARYGGEEFVIIMPRTSKNSALWLANRLRKEVQDIKKRLNTRITISGGISEFPADSNNSEDLIRCADKALYRAKYLGKNKICLYNKRMQSKKNASKKRRIKK